VCACMHMCVCVCVHVRSHTHTHTYSHSFYNLSVFEFGMKNESEYSEDLYIVTCKVFGCVILN
jgi:hypothetical protein